MNCLNSSVFVLVFRSENHEYLFFPEMSVVPLKRCRNLFYETLVETNIFLEISWKLEPRVTNTSRTNLFTKKCFEQKKKKKSRMTNGVLVQWTRELATSREYRQETVSCGVVFAPYTALFEFTVPSIEFNCFLCFLVNYYLRLQGDKEG